MRGRVQKWGNSLALRIPKTYAMEVNLSQDMEVDIAIEDGRLIITPVLNNPWALEDLVAQITDENRHQEMDFGPPVGKEVW